MNLATIEAIRQGITGIAQQAQVGRHGDDFNTGATEMHRRIDNYLCELIEDEGGEVKEPEVFRYIEVRTFGNPVQKILHRENEYGGSTYFWERRMKELEKKINNPALFAEVFEYDTEQELIDCFLETDKEPGQEIPWDDLSEWVQWVAMDADKDWFQYENEPILQGDCEWWFDSKNTLKTGQRPVKTKKIAFTAPDWRTSLRQRPAKTTEQ